MKHAKLFSILVLIMAALYGVTGFYFLPLASYQGDLTRIGMLPESLFGWTKAQPAIDPALMLQASWQDADVLVIGDSFSDKRIWQTVLAGHALRVHTEHWDNIRDICADFSPWLHAQGFKGKYVVIEAIERGAQDRFAHSVPCKKMDFHHNIDMEHREPPETLFNHDKKDFSGKLSVGIKTRINMFSYEQLSAQPDFHIWIHSGVKITRVAQGCDLFSHPACQDALFLEEDSDQDLGDDVISNMEILNTRFNGLMPIWAVVPNKSTVYLYPDKHFWDKLEKRFHAANILTPVRQAIKVKTIDVYPAHDTHFSTTGYLLMGEEIYRKLKSDNLVSQ